MADAKGGGGLYGWLCLLAVLPFVNALSNAFVAGDLQFVVDNPALRAPDFWYAAFTHGYWFTGGGSEGNMYRPIIVLVNGLELWLWGERPLPFHLTNIALHVGCTWLSASCFAQLCPKRPRVVGCAAALFAVHPLHVHAVTYIQGRTDLLSTLAFLGALRCLLPVRSVSAPRLASALVLYGLALLSKESAITWLPVVAACLWAAPKANAPGRTPTRALKLGFLAALAVTAGYFALRAHVLDTTLSHRTPTWETLGVGPWLLTCAKVYGYYLHALCWPSRQAFLPPFLPAFDAGDGAAWASVLLLALGASVILGLAFRVPKLARALLLWLGLTFAPVSGVVPLGYWVKENYAYLPSVAFCLLVGLAGAALWQASTARLGHPPLRDAVWRPLLVLGVLTCIGLTWLQNRSWRTPETFYEHIIVAEQSIPDAIFRHPGMVQSAYRFGTARLNYGLLLRKKSCEKALPHYARAAELLVGSGGHQARMLSAECYATRGKLQAAAALWQAALADSHRYSGIAAEKLAMLWARRGDSARANAYLARACELGRTEACAQVPPAQPPNASD